MRGRVGLTRSAWLLAVRGSLGPSPGADAARHAVPRLAAAFGAGDLGQLASHAAAHVA